MSVGALPPEYESVRNAVLRFGRFRKRWAVLEGLGLFLLAGPGLLLAWILLDWAVGLPAWPLVILFALVCAAGVYAVVRWLAPPPLRPVEPDREALLIEDLHGELDNQVIGALQLGREAEDAARRGHSRSLVTALVRATAERLGAFDPCGLLNLTAARRAFAGGVLVIALFLGVAVTQPGVVGARFDRLAEGWAAVLDTLFPVEMHVTPGNTAIVRGRSIPLAAELRGARRDTALLHIWAEGAADPVTHELSLEPVVRDGAEADLAQHTVEAVEEPFTYAFEYGGRRSETYRIDVGDLPKIAAINYELAYPAYTGQPPRTLTGKTSKLQALAGTHVLVSFAATTELHPDLCYVEWQDGTRPPIVVNGRFGHFSFTITRPERAEIHLTGHYGRGFEMESPMGLAIAVEQDRRPDVRIRSRKRELVLLAEQAAAYALPFEAEDDFGVAEVTLTYRIDTVDEMLGRSPRDGESARRIDPPRDRVKGAFEDLFRGLEPPLQPGDRVRIQLSAKDNNTETGPGLGRSQSLEIVVVRPDLAQFKEKEFGFGGRAAVLGGLKKVKRVTDLLLEAERTVRTEKAVDVDKQEVKARVSAENWPSGSEDAVGDYFRLLSGGQ